MKKILSRKQKTTKNTGLPEPDYKALCVKLQQCNENLAEGARQLREREIALESQVGEARIVTQLQNADDRRRIEGVQACRDHEVAHCRSLITFPIETIDFLMRYARRGILETRKSQPSSQRDTSCQTISDALKEEGK